MTLDAIGNITWKQGIGNYTYHATKRRAVITAGSNSYGYDANGNMNSRLGSSITYTSYDLPTGINAPGGYSSTIVLWGVPEPLQADRGVSRPAPRPRSMSGGYWRR